jgi:hypothetical protein
MWTYEPARAGRQQRQFALRLPWSPWHFFRKPAPVFERFFEADFQFKNSREKSFINAREL